jgi:phosphopantothenoylcysteine decarboxylase/phosphopantothenate--cysteine ligase
MLQDKRILLGVTGSIAAYKACDIVQRLKEKGANVRAIMTPSAAQIVHPNALAALTGQPVLMNAWDGVSEGRMPHIDAARWADLFLVAPCTAHTLAELALGLTGSSLSMTALAYRGPMAVAPAMNTVMLQSAPVQAHLDSLSGRGVHVLPTLDGNLACGEIGEGKLTTPEEIAAYADLILEGRGVSLRGKSVVISGGHTEEPLDGVRFLANRSSGKTAVTLARAFRLAGADVHLVLGRAEEPAPNGLALTRVKTSAEFHAVMTASAQTADVVVMAAAIADFIPVLPAETSAPTSARGAAFSSPKPIKWKGSRERKQLDLEPAVNILQDLGEHKPKGQVLVGFALETEDALAHGREKLKARNCDFIVVNTPLSQPEMGFGREAVEAVILESGKDDAALRPLDKSALAAELVRRVAGKLSGAP